MTLISGTRYAPRFQTPSNSLHFWCLRSEKSVHISNEWRSRYWKYLLRRVPEWHESNKVWCNGWLTIRIAASMMTGMRWDDVPRAGYHSSWDLWRCASLKPKCAWKIMRWPHRSILLTLSVIMWSSSLRISPLAVIPSHGIITIIVQRHDLHTHN